ncbi:hypothetical protein ARMSODRAFT_1085393 [Armillaria solidipes]|uniref:Uncharacterized protein n=1 Tax=Armillaria solidipes TaxID=1076256 RepID=A0A2H3BC44_9AGAR|nr:hypothetical protein ARMSODRAFT_1085393 [Armillaria solidipes]
MPQNMSGQQRPSPPSPRRLISCFITSLLFVTLVPAVCITLALRLRPGGELSYVRDPNAGELDRTISLHADLISVDISQTTMLVEWTIDWDTCGFSNCTEVNIFFDTNLFPKDARREDSPYSNNRPTDPIFVWNVIDWNLGTNGYLTEDNDATFRTELIIYPQYDYTQHALEHSHASLVYYPFDRYNSEIFAFAEEASTNESVSLVLDSATGLIVDLKITTDVIGENITYWEDWSPAKTAIDVVVTLQRSTLIIAYCLIITFTFWLVTLMICLIMIATVIFGFRQRNEIVVVPIGTVFAFTQLRSAMPGAPDGFGDILDFAGLLPCLVLLSISAVTMVGIYLFADPDDPSRRTFTWDELANALHNYIQSIWYTVNDWVRRARARRIRRAPDNDNIPLMNTTRETSVGA